MIQSNDIFFLIEVVGFGLAFILGTTYASMVYMRIKNPEIPRPIKVCNAMHIADFAFLNTVPYEKSISRLRNF